MKKCFVSNRGATLIELITSIAILSIVGLSCFTLLMFSIRTNRLIFASNSACRDAEVLNDRLEVLFQNATIAIDDTAENIVAFDLDGNKETVELTWSDSTLMQGEEMLLQDGITDFSAEIIEGTKLLRVQYTIDDTYKCTKVFSFAFVADESSMS